MSRSEHTEIWRERHRLSNERREFLQKAMEDFDREHFAKVRALQARCAAIGHVRGNFHDNGWGSTWFYCNQCGATFDHESYTLG